MDWVLSSLSEGKEEVLQDFISQLSAKAIYDKDKEVFSLSDQGAIINPERMAKEFGLGAAAGGIMGGGMLTFNSIVNSKTKAEYKQIGATARKLGDVDGLINYAQRSIDNDVRTLAYNTDSESISDLELGQLYAYACRDIDSAINSPKELNIAIDNFNEIASSTDSKLINGIASSRLIERLTSAGIDSESAEYIIDDNESGVKTDIGKSENETDNSINDEFGTKSAFTEYSSKKYKADPIESYMAKEHGREKLSDDQLQIVMVARKLGHSVVFEDTAKTRGFKSDGYIENDGTIHIDYDNTKPVQFVFKHELTHYSEGSELYKNFVETVKASKTYAKWITQKIGGEDSAAVKSAKYRQSVIDGYAASGIELTPMQAESELIADFVGDTLFTEDGSGLESIMSDMNAKQRKSFVQYIKDFFAYIKDKLSRNKTATSDILRLEKMFNETLSAVEQRNTSDEVDVKYSLRVGAEADVERALNDKNYTEDVFLTESSPSIITSQKGARNLPMLMKASHIRENIFTEQEAKQSGLKVNSNINYHGLGKDLFLKVIDGLDDVKLAYRGTKNASNPSRRENYFLLISQYKDANGNIINIPVFIDEKGQYNRVFIDTNKIATVFGRTDINDYINREVANKNLVRIKNKSTQASELTSPINASYSKNAFTDNTVSQKTQSVKNNISENTENSTEKLSDRTPEQLDTDYMQAVNNGDMETARRLVDEAAKLAGYNKKLYHQTGNDFTEFNTDNQQAGKYDDELPSGIFLKGSSRDIGLKGKKQMSLYVKAENTLNFLNRDSAQKYWSEHLSEYSKIKEEIKRIDDEYRAKTDKAFADEKKLYREIWQLNREGKISDEEYQKRIDLTERKSGELTKEWTEKSNRKRAEAKNLINQYILNSDYDSVYIGIDNGSFGRTTEALIVFNSNQVKSADPVTYDDNGNIIPLSQRFNAENSDIRYSIPFNQAELLDKYDRGEISREEYLKQSNENWKEAVNNYGTIETGENPVNDIPVPQSVDGNQKTQRFARTVIESGKLTNRMVEDMGADILLGKFAYTPVSDESAQAAADKAVKGGFAESSWQEAVNASKLITKDKIAIGEKLLMQAIANKDTKRALELSSELADVLTRNGQNIQAASMFKKMTGAGKLLTVQQYVNTLNKDLEAKYGENAPTVKINELIAQQIAESKPGEDIYSIYEDALQDVAAQVPATFLDKWNAWRYMSMLVNPTTHIRNIAGNGLFIPSVRMKDFISASLETAFIKDKDKRTKSVVIKKEYKEFAEKDLTRSEVKNALKSGGKFNIETEISEKQRIFKNNALEFVRVGNGNLLETEDLIFKNIHYKHALAGFLQARGAGLNNIDESSLWEARAYAVQEAMKATFNDANSISTALSAAANKNNALNIAINGVLPFKKTPVNIVRRGVEYSPLGLLKTVVKGSYDLKQGKITASEYIDGLGAGISGTVVFALGAFLSSLGWVTGGFGDDEEDKFKKLNGEQEYALQLFGKSYTIDWAAPACIPFFIGVETVNALRQDNEGFKLSDITEAMWNSLEPVINLSMLSGVQSMIESVKYAAEDKSVISLAGNIAKSYFSQGLPTVLGKTARTLDSKRRSNYIDKNSQLSEFTQSAINTAKSKIPGLEATRPEYINAWGQAESNGNVAERIFGNFVSPGYYSDIEYSEMSEELLRLSEAVKGEDISVFPKTAQKSFEVNGKTKHLTAEEYKKYAKAKGQYSYDYVSEFVNSSEYKKLTDEERAKVISNLYKYANAKAKTEVSDYDITKSFKSVSQWEKRGKSPVVYYLGKVLSEK
ncbi:MAG: hypothetical protein ACI4FN_07765 [Acutalibacteraceae bacterium]